MSQRKKLKKIEKIKIGKPKNQNIKKSKNKQTNTKPKNHVTLCGTKGKCVDEFHRKISSTSSSVFGQYGMYVHVHIHWILLLFRSWSFFSVSPAASFSVQSSVTWCITYLYGFFHQFGFANYNMPSVIANFDQSRRGRGTVYRITWETQRIPRRIKMPINLLVFQLHPCWVDKLSSERPFFLTWSRRHE